MIAACSVVMASPLFASRPDVRAQKALASAIETGDLRALNAAFALDPTLASEHLWASPFDVPIYAAITRGQQKAASLILHTIIAANGVNGAVGRDLPPLLQVASIPKCSPALVGDLLDHGANLSIRTTTRHYETPGPNPLMFEGYAPKGLTALHFAALAGNAPVVKLLIAKGIDVNVRSESDDTPLHVACLAGADAVPALLDAHADTNARDNVQDIPLDIAIRSNQRWPSATLALG
jgi:hypothetical protein